MLKRSQSVSLFSKHRFFRVLNKYFTKIFIGMRQNSNKHLFMNVGCKKKPGGVMENKLECWAGSDNVSKFNKKDGYIDIYTPHALIQLAGYIKYIMRDEIVVYRGQTKDYDTLEPALCRTMDKGKRISDEFQVRKVRELNLVIDELAKQQAFVPGVEREFYEAILQHYGFKTQYIDFVDNIWVALVFSSLSWLCNSSSVLEELSYFDNEEYGYIYILSAGKVTEAGATIYTDKSYEVVDLRKCLPSLYLRPHAQHGILIKKFSRKGNKTTPKTNMYDDIIAKIRIPKASTIKWINNSKVLTPDFLFPSAYFDIGYSYLAERDINNIYKKLLDDKVIKYSSVNGAIKELGGIKRYTYDGTTSDYLQLNCR